MGLCIGTVQFGIDYGVQGGRKPPLETAVGILDYALAHGVDAIDTSDDYGNAEEVVGAFVKGTAVPRADFEIITKFSVRILEGLREEEYGARLIGQCERSLGRLGTDYVDAYICHDPWVAGNAAVMDALKAVKAKGLAKRIGISVYESEEALAAAASDGCDFVQGPYSVLDQRMKSSGALKACAAKGIDVHTRSCFVQGLMLMDVAAIPERLANTRPYVEKLERLCAAAGVTRRELALAYVKAQPEISHILFGVDNLGQLEEIVDDYAKTVPADVVTAIEREFTVLDQNIFMPNKWKK